MTKRFLPFLSAFILCVVPIYYVRFSVLGVPTNLLEILVVIFALFVAISKGFQLPPPYWQACVILLIGLVLGSVVSPDKRVALGILKGWFIIPMIFAWAVTQTVDEKAIHMWTGSLWVNAVGVGLYAVLQKLGYIPLLGHQLATIELEQYLTQGRAIAFFESPNYLAMYLVPLILFVGISLWAQKKWWAISLLLIPIVAVVFSGSRAGLVALTGGAVMGGMLLLSVRSKFVWLGGGLLGGAGLLAYIVPNLKLDGVDSLRVGIWRSATEIIATHPWLGIGPGQFRTAFQQVTVLSEPLRNAAEPYALHPHNLLFSFWLSGGILGLFGFLWVLVRSVRYVVCSLNTPTRVVAISVLSALVAIVLHGLFDTTYFKNDLSFFFWFFVALAWWANSSTSPKTI